MIDTTNLFGQDLPISDLIEIRLIFSDLNHVGGQCLLHIFIL